FSNRFRLQQRLGFRLCLFQFQLLCFSLFGFQHGFWDRFSVRRCLPAGRQLWSNLCHSGLRQLSPSCPRLLLQFLEARIVSRLFPVGRELGFLFLDFLFFHCAVHTFVRNFLYNLVGKLRRRRRVRLVHRRFRLRVSVHHGSRLVPEFSYFRRGAGRRLLLLFLNF